MNAPTLAVDALGELAIKAIKAAKASMVPAMLSLTLGVIIPVPFSATRRGYVSENSLS